jgi:hypothetical protein
MFFAEICRYIQCPGKRPVFCLSFEEFFDFFKIYGIFINRVFVVTKRRHIMAKFACLGPIAVLMVCFMVFSGCGSDKNESKDNDLKSLTNPDDTKGTDEPGTFEGLSAKTERQIKVDYLNNYLNPETQSVENVHFDYYLGKHCGYEIIVVLGDAAVMSEVTIADYTFIFGNGGIRMLAWKQDENGSGRFYEVQDAYKRGLLTKDDVRSMHELYTLEKMPTEVWPTGEDDGGVPPAEPQWEKKIYWNGTIEEDFDGYTVLLVMDKKIGGPNKVHDKSFFGDIEIESIEDLTILTGDINGKGIDWGIWRQILCIKLPGDSKENVVRAIRHLEKIDGINSVNPNHYWYRGNNHD